MRKQDKREHIQERLATFYSSSATLVNKSMLFSALSELNHSRKIFNHIVDLGCGLGGTADYLSGHYQRYTGIDQSREIIEAARHIHAGNPNVEFQTRPAEKTGLPSQSVDLVLMVGILHHNSPIEPLIEEASRLLAPNKFLLIIEPHYGSLVNLSFRFVKSLVGAEDEGARIYYSPEFLIKRLTQQGFIETQLSYWGYLATPFKRLFTHPPLVTLPMSLASLAMDSLFTRIVPESVHVLSSYFIITCLRASTT